MKAFLLPHLICPACLPKENPLDIKAQKMGGHDNGEISFGELHCPKCRKIFPIKDGIANFQVNQDLRGIRYEESDMVDRYLWSHYADLLVQQGQDNPSYFWETLLETGSSSAFDAGCSVGRLVFEMGNKSGWAVGCDLSGSFIHAARTLMNNRRCRFSLPLEGKLREAFEIALPDSWRTDNVEFIIADAQYLPFRRETFQQISSLNLLDRVPYPLAHLYEMNRVASPKEASFLFADPFSWLTSPAPEERWLGGSATGSYAGRGRDIVRGLLQGNGSILLPAWEIKESGLHKWTLRTHQNHRELIYSDFMVANR